MGRYFRYILLSVVCLLGSMTVAWAQRIAVSVPSHVSAGENFRLAYTINTQDVEDFRAAWVCPVI